MSNAFFIKIPKKYRRQSQSAEVPKQLNELPPVWTFETESLAIEFAKSFTICWVEVWYQGQVIFRNFDASLKQWVIDYRGKSLPSNPVAKETDKCPNCGSANIANEDETSAIICHNCSSQFEDEAQSV